MKTIKIYLLSLTLLGISFSACEDKLAQVNPNALTTGNFWKSADDFNKGLNAVYSALQFPNVSGGEVVYDMLRSDFSGTEVWYGRHLEFTNLAWTDVSDYVTNRWSQLYIGVFRANQLLEYLQQEDISNLSAEEKTLMEAQARFLRGVYYFWLSYTYNGAVIHTEVVKDTEGMQKPFSPKSDVLSQAVVPDLTFAYENLPKRWDGVDNLGRATWGAAASMLGKMYLYEKDWSNAAKYFKEVIDEANTGLYRLTDDFMDNFTLEGEFNSESIFEVVFSDNYKAGASGGNHDDINGVPGSEATSMASGFASITGAGGYNVCLPTYWLQELFVSGDSIDVSNPVNVGKRYSRRTYASIVVEFGDGDYYQAPLTTDPVTGEKSKANFSYGQGSKVKKYTNWYWKEAEDVSTGSRTGINFRHIRLADIYLMYAEAILEQNGDAAVSEALGYVDMLRSRAGVMTLQSYMDANSGQIPEMHISKFANQLNDWPYVAMNAQSLLTHIKMVERPLELAFEGHRWYDLVRWGQTGEIFAARRAEEEKLETILAPYLDTEKIYPLYLNQRVRLDFIIPAANYSSASHDYLPIPSIERQANEQLN